MPDPKDLTYRDEVHGYVITTIRMPIGFTYVYETNVKSPDGKLGVFVRGTNTERDAIAAHASAIAFVRGKIQ